MPTVRFVGPFGDIVVRALGDSGGPDTRVRDVMTQDIKYCYEDDDVSDVVTAVQNVPATIDRTSQTVQTASSALASKPADIQSAQNSVR